MADLKALADAVIKGDQDTSVKITKAALAEGMAAKSVLDDGLIAGMDVVGFADVCDHGHASMWDA